MKANNFKVLFLLWLLGCGVLQARAAPESERREEQRHGYIFEKWVRDTFFDGYVLENYTQLWDVPKERNKKFGEIPVQIKMTKYGTAVDLGDALRQFQINEKFLLIIGYWKQEGDKKRVVNIVATEIEPKLWRQMWEPIALSDLQELDSLIKDRARDFKEVRKEARQMKRRAPFSKAVFGLNPKIDSKTQRRLQCSLKFKKVFELLAPKADAGAMEKPQLFGVEALEAFESAPRER